MRSPKAFLTKLFFEENSSVFSQYDGADYFFGFEGEGLGFKLNK